MRVRNQALLITSSHCQRETERSLSYSIKLVYIPILKKLSFSMWQLTLLPSWWHSIVFKDFTSILVGWFSSFSFLLQRWKKSDDQCPHLFLFLLLQSSLMSRQQQSYQISETSKSCSTRFTNVGASMLVTMIHNLMKTDSIIHSTKQTMKKCWKMDKMGFQED